MEYISANIVEKVPEEAKKWTAEEVQVWAKDRLAGGPPDMPVDVETGESIKWSDIKRYVGKKVRLIARPKGLILIFDDGRRQYIAGDTATSSGARGRGPLGSTAEMQKKSEIENRIRAFAKEEVKRYNKNVGDTIRKQKGTATYEFWASGKRILNFLKENSDISLENLTLALEQWGRGEYGYGKRTFEYAVYFFDWRKDLKPEDPIFTLSETRIMNIIIAGRDDIAARVRLVEACLEGPFKNLTDSQFKWITGQSRGNFSQDMQLFEKLHSYGIKVMKGEILSKEESDGLIAILSNL